MPRFEIRYEVSIRDASRRAGSHLFCVRSGDTEAMLAVEFPDDLGRQWGLGRRANADEIQRRAALACLKEHLSATGALAGQHGRKLLLTAWELPHMPAHWSVYQVPKECPYERKECKHQHSRAGERLCGAAREGDRIGGRTTLALCEACGLPSTDILCDKLVNVETAGFGTDQISLRKRSLIGAQCDIGSEQFVEPAPDARLCVPGGRNCWVQTYEPEQVAVRAEIGERDLAAEALDMVDTLNIIFRDQFDLELFRLKQFRTGRVLMGSCSTEEALVLKLQALADLIDLVNSKELGQAQGVTSKRGSLNWLTAFLEKVAQGDPTSVVQTLRDIRTVRNQVAAHSAAVEDFVAACGRLGIHLPITDWEDAWHRLVSAFLDALRRLQGLLP